MNLRVAFLPFLAIFMAFTASGVSQISGTASPKAAGQNSDSAAMTITARPLFTREIKKTIAIIYTTCEGDSHEYEGTAFFVAKEDPRLRGNGAFGYLVTNRHVAQPHIETGHPCKVLNQVIRVNTKTPNPITGGRNFLFTNNLQWTYPADGAIDLAVIPFMPDQMKFDVEAIPMSMFATQDLISKEDIAEGDSVLYTGFFYQFPGSLQIEPIIRQGIIAMMPSEPILTTLGRLGRAYLADAHVFGGNSGSPMFVNLAGARNGSLIMGSRYAFLGVVSGLEPEQTDIALQPVATYSGKIDANSGVSFIIPADQVADLINGPEMTTAREEAIKRLQAAK